MYQGSMEEWIDSSTQPNIANLLPCLYHKHFGFQGRDLPNLPPCHYRFTTPASPNPQKLAVDIPTLLCQYLAMLGETQNQFSLTRAALRTSGRAKNKFSSKLGPM